MATIFAATSLELEPEKKKELIDALGETIGTIFKTYSLYYTPVPAENVSEGAKDQMTFFAVSYTHLNFRPLRGNHCKYRAFCT